MTIRQRIRWAVVGVLLAGSAAAWLYARDWRGEATMPGDTRDGILAQLHATEARRVRELALSEREVADLAARWGEKYASQVQVTRRWRALAERRPAIVTTGTESAPVSHEPDQPVEVARGCVLTDATVEGGCNLEILMVDNRPAARAEWWAIARGRINDEPFSLESERRRVEVTGEAAQEPPRPLPPLWTVQAGPWLEADQLGLRAGIARYGAGRRLGYWVEGDYAVDPLTVAGDGLDYSADRWRLAGGVALRLGRR